VDQPQPLFPPHLLVALQRTANPGISGQVDELELQTKAQPDFIGNSSGFERGPRDVRDGHAGDYSLRSSIPLGSPPAEVVAVKRYLCSHGQDHG
jgi:hypothetical protein